MVGTSTWSLVVGSEPQVSWGHHHDRWMFLAQVRAINVLVTGLLTYPRGLLAAHSSDDLTASSAQAAVNKNVLHVVHTRFE